MYWIIAVVFVTLLTVTYLWHCNRAVATAPDEALQLAQTPWTEEQIRSAYRRVQITPTDVKPYLFSKRNRRYVVCGGSGIHISHY